MEPAFVHESPRPPTSWRSRKRLLRFRWIARRRRARPALRPRSRLSDALSRAERTGNRWICGGFAARGGSGAGRMPDPMAHSTTDSSAPLSGRLPRAPGSCGSLCVQSLVVLGRRLSSRERGSHRWPSTLVLTPSPFSGRAAFASPQTWPVEPRTSPRRRVHQTRTWGASRISRPGCATTLRSSFIASTASPSCGVAGSLAVIHP